ncbi:MAG: S41 family peptidase [Victivallales bacterium]|nr:S41 family peptidase [Victivallales bacterium]
MKRFVLGILVALLATNLFLGYHVYAAETAKAGGDDEVLARIDRLMTVLQLIRQNYVDIDKVSTLELLDGAIDGLTSKLDPFSQYLPPHELQELNEETEGEFGGIGITVQQTEEHELKIIKILPNAPGERAGLMLGDIIQAVDDKPTTEEDFNNSMLRIRGKVGSKVKITIKRPSSEKLLNFQIVRERIPVPSILYTQVLPETTIGYVHIVQFAEPTAKDLQKTLKSFLDQKVTGVILDLRENPGGLLESAVDICSYFLKPKSLVCTTRRHSDTRENRESENFHQFLSNNKWQFPSNIPIVLLVNGNSASASEITAACLQDHKRATLIGTKTFGKGSVQNIIELDGGSALKLTMARYYTSDPNRETIDKHGVLPDQTVEMTQEQLATAFLNLENQQVNLEEDAQLKAAVDFLSSKPQTPAP